MRRRPAPSPSFAALLAAARRHLDELADVLADHEERAIALRGEPVALLGGDPVLRGAPGMVRP